MKETKVRVARNYKDTVFRMLYSDKRELLELYNALNDTQYEQPESLEIYTLENAIYMNMKNDISFIIDSELSLYEQQSTYNPNIPLRNLFYVSRQLEKYVRKETIYSSVQIRIPVPRFVVFYNGVQGQPERKLLRLSDAFEKETDDPELELKVLMLNLNAGQNKELLEKCRTLCEYCIFVERVRGYAKELALEEAVERAVSECIHEGILEEFLRSQRAEVIAVSIFEYNEEEEMKKIRAAEHRVGYEKGVKAGEIAGELRGKREAVLSLLADMGSVPKEIRAQIETEGDCEQLNKWLKTAAKAASLDDFVRQI